MPRGQVQLGEIADEPAWSGIILLGGLDECRVDIDTDHHVAGRGEIPADAAGAATGIEKIWAPRGAIASTSRASPVRSSPACANERKRSMYHCECPGLAATFFIQMLCSTMRTIVAADQAVVGRCAFTASRTGP